MSRLIGYCNADRYEHFDSYSSCKGTKVIVSRLLLNTLTLVSC